MKVFRILPDGNNYQYFLTEKEEDGRKLITNCQPRLATWNPPTVYVYEPLHRKGDFFQFSRSVLISNTRATEALRSFYEMAGELLPLPYHGEVYTLLNVTECINCLDEEKSEWEYYEGTEVKHLLKRYVFHPNRFSASALFKIPQTYGIELYAVEGSGEVEEEFREVVKKNHLQGLIFQELWSDDE